MVGTTLTIERERWRMHGAFSGCECRWEEEGGSNFFEFGKDTEDFCPTSPPGTGPARVDDMLLLPSSWTYEAGLPTEAWGVLGRRSSSHRWDKRGLSLFLLTLVWVRGTSFSCRVLHKHLRQYRWARVWVEVKYKAHKPRLRGTRGVSTPLYHRLNA